MRLFRKPKASVSAANIVNLLFGVSEKGFAEGVQKALNLTGLEGFQIMSEKDFLKRRTKPSDEKAKPNRNLYPCFEK